MAIPLLDLKAQYASIKPEIDAVIAEVVESCRFIGGDQVTGFEEDVAAYLGVQHAVSLNSGTDALYLAVRALGIGPGDEVITTPFTFIATAEIIAQTGATPVFVDIDDRTYCIDPAQIERAVTERTKAILPVHLFGQAADWDPIEEIAGRYDLRLIEDSAQAIGALYRGRKVCALGDVGCLSFFPSKNLGAYGDGGMVVTDDDEIAARIRSMAVHGKGTSKYVNERLGVNSRLDAIQAAILRVKLPHLDEWNEQRRANAALYDDLLGELDGVITPSCAEGNTHVYHQYSIRVPSRDRIQSALGDAGIGTAVYYPLPLHLQTAFEYLGYARGDMPVSERASAEILSLPIYPELTEGEIRGVVRVIGEAL